MNENAYQSLHDNESTIIVHCTMLRSLAKAFFITGNQKAHRELETAAQIIEASAGNMIDIVDEHIKLNVETDTELITLMAKRFGGDGFTEVTVLAQKSGGEQ